MFGHTRICMYAVLHVLLLPAVVRGLTSLVANAGMLLLLLRIRALTSRVDQRCFFKLVKWGMGFNNHTMALAPSIKSSEEDELCTWTGEGRHRTFETYRRRPLQRRSFDSNILHSRSVRTL